MSNSDLQEKLLKKHYYEKCPGCMVDKMKERQRGVPLKQLFTIWSIVLCAGKHITFLL